MVCFRKSTAPGPKLNPSSDPKAPNPLLTLQRLANTISQAVDQEDWDNVNRYLALFDKMARTTRFSARDKPQIAQLIATIDAARSDTQRRQAEVGKLIQSLSGQ